MYLILAIIIGVFLFSRTGFDAMSYKSAVRDIDSNIDSMKSAYEEFSRKYGNKRLEQIYAEDIKNSSDFSKRIAEEISIKTGLEPSREMVLMGMMAESCKIPQKFIDGGISSPIRGKMTDSQFDDYSKKYLSFIRWYNNKLRANGMEQDLLYVKNDKDSRLWYKNKPEYCKDICHVDNPRFQAVYIWWDARFYTTPFGRIIS